MLITRAGRMIERATDRIPFVRHVPVVRLLLAAQIILIFREHYGHLEPGERRRLWALLKAAHGRPRNLSAPEREELRALVAKAEPRLFAGEVAEQISPVKLPQRIVRGPRKDR